MSAGLSSGIHGSSKGAAMEKIKKKKKKREMGNLCLDLTDILMD
jgi:hypothetical protein